MMIDTSETSATSPDLSRSTEPPEDESPTVCYLCRQRKTKCDRKLPRCGYCIKAKINCQYVAQPKKRGLRAGYVSELEARLGTYLLSLLFLMMGILEGKSELRLHENAGFNPRQVLR
jgi:hypothetical protein